MQITAWAVGEKILERYVVKHVLHGGMGTVYLAWDPVDHERYAVKSPRADRILSPDVLRRFLHEANLWISLGEHPNIVRAAFTELPSPGRPLLFLEWVDGSDLRSRLGAGPIPLAQVLDYAIQLCNGMQYAHDALRTVHRDIKPENVLLTPEGQLKLTDFGLARGLLADEPAPGDGLPDPSHGRPRVTQEGAILGTLEYMSPEQLRGAADAGPAADIYSFGVMLYEMLTGELPYDLSVLRKRKGPELAAALLDLQTRQRPLHLVQRRAEIPAELDELVQSCLDVQADRRFAGFQALREELIAIYLRLMERRGPEQKAVIDAFNDRGVSLQNAGRYQEAITHYDTVLRLDPRHHFACNNKANSLMDLAAQHALGNQSGDRAAEDFDTMLCHYQSAIRCSERSLLIEPGFELAWNTKGGCLVSTGRFARALECFERAVALNPQYETAWYNRGTCLRRLGRHAEALASYDQALQLKPQYPNALSGKGNCLAQMGRYAEAVACLDQALAIDPSHAAAAHNRELWTRVARGERDFAIVVPAFRPDADEHFKALLTKPEQKGKKIEPRRARDRTTQELCNEAWGLKNLGRFEEALERVEQALAREPEFSTAWLQKGRILRNKGCHGEAIAAFDRALDLDPDYHLVWLNKGLALDDLGRHEDALQWFDRYIAAKPDDPPGWLNKGQALQKLERWAEADRSYEQALRLDPKNSGAWLNRALIAEAKGDLQRALEYTAKGLEADPADARAWLVRGQILQETNGHEEAVACFDQAMRLDPHDPKGWLGKATSLSLLRRQPEVVLECCARAREAGHPEDQHLRFLTGRGLYELKRYEEALGVWDQMLAVDSEGAETWVQKATTLVQMDRYREAAFNYLNAMRRGVTDRGIVELASVAFQNGYPEAVAALEKGFGLVERGDGQGALSWFTKARELCPTWWEVWDKLGAALVMLGRFDEAVSWFTESLKVYPESAAIWTALAGSHYGLGQWQTAVDDYGRALELDPGLADAWFSMGLALDRLGQKEAATNCFERSLELSKDNKDRLIAQGLVLSKGGRNQEAAAHFERALGLDPKDAAVWYYRGSAAAVLGRHEEALRDLDQALARKPDLAVAWTAKGQTLTGLARMEEALACFDQALEIEPELAATWRHKGVVLGLLGRPADALACLDRALALEPRHADAWFSRGFACEKLEDSEQALASYQRATELDPGDVRSWFNKGVLLLKLQRPQEALACFEAARRLGAPQAERAVAVCRQQLEAS